MKPIVPNPFTIKLKDNYAPAQPSTAQKILAVAIKEASRLPKILIFVLVFGFAQAQKAPQKPEIDFIQLDSLYFEDANAQSIRNAIALLSHGNFDVVSLGRTTLWIDEQKMLMPIVLQSPDCSTITLSQGHLIAFALWKEGIEERRGKK